MYIFKNALKSITRTKARNILIGIIIVVIAISSCIALSIKNSANRLIESYQNSYDIEGELTMNRESMRKEATKEKTENATSAKDFMSGVDKITIDQVKNYGDSIYVDSYYSTSQIQMNSSNMQKATIEETTNTEQINQGRKDMGGGETFGATLSNKVAGDFKIIGYSSLEAMTDFTDGTYQITSGQIFDMNASDKNCVISQDLAEENTLSVGSKITLVNPNQEGETYEFTVVGIYTDSSSSDEFTMFSNAANQILTTYKAVSEMVEASQSNTDSALQSQLTAKFKLTNANVIGAFQEELTSKGLSEYYTLTTNVESLETSIKPIQNLSTFATTFFVLVLVIGGVILLIINMINIRERKYEIGVLRSIGMKKHMVLGQFTIELFIVTTIAIIIGTITGAFLAVPVANAMLQTEITTLQESNDKVSENFGMPGGSQTTAPSSSSGGKSMNGKAPDIRDTFGNESVSYVDKLNTVIDIKTVLELVGIGILLTIISSSVSMILIARCSPLKILSNRT